MPVASAISHLTRICRSHTTALRFNLCSSESLDRYNIIRTFFIQQRWHTTNHAYQLHTNRRVLIEGYFTQKHARPSWLLLNSTTCSDSFRVYSTTRSLREEHSSKIPNLNRPSTTKEPSSESPTPTDMKPPDPPPPNFDNYPQFFRRLALSLPHLHRPTRDDFLNATTGFWQRLHIRFRWFTIRSFRRFNADDISAFITLLLMSQTVWILVGTTTFFSVIFSALNSLRLQEYVARALSDYLTAETGDTVIFESAIVPKWKDSRISFKNVYISRRPSSFRPKVVKTDEHAAVLGYDVSGHPAIHRYGEEEEDRLEDTSSEDVNYSQFDLNIDSVDVTLSLWRWLDGKGLIEDAVIRGVRGVLDRRSITWDPENPFDPAAFRHPVQPGDFELESLELEDVLITVYQPGDFRPFTASIFRAEMRNLRKQWLFYDFLASGNVVGQFDNCLFSLHRPQSIGRTTEKDLQDSKWSRMSRFRIDGVNIDHLQNSVSDGGPISWITSGKFDAVLDIKFPQDPSDGDALNVLLGEIADAITTASTSLLTDRIPGQRELAKPPLSAPETEEESMEDKDTPKVTVDIDLRFRDLKAAVPIFTQDLSYVNNALIRPIVAFINSNRTLIPIRCKVVKNLTDFDGSWTLWETGLIDDMSLKIYDALAYHVSGNVNRRIKTVGAWSLQMTATAMITALRSMMDPVAVQVKEAYAQAQSVQLEEALPATILAV